MLPALRAGASCQVGQVGLKVLKTLPPKPYTQGELVKAMKGVAKLVTDPRLKQKLKDTTGIGTEATRANIISGLLARGYLLKKGRAIRASDAAFTLIDAVPTAIADPGTTAVWGAGAGHDRGRPDDAGHLHRQAIELGRPARAAVPRRHARPQAATRTELPAVRCPDAPAQRQERRVLVVQPLPGLQGRSRSKMPRQASAAHPAEHPAHRVGAPGELTPSLPLPRRLLPTAGANLPRPRTPQRVPFCNGVRVLHRPITACRTRRSLLHRIALVAVPLIEVLRPFTSGLLTPRPAKLRGVRRPLAVDGDSVPVPAGGTTGSLCVDTPGMPAPATKRAG